MVWLPEARSINVRLRLVDWLEIGPRPLLHLKEKMRRVKREGDPAQLGYEDRSWETNQLASSIIPVR